MKISNGVSMKERYQIFARKYRPQLFKDVVGQEAIIKTLKNSLKYNRSSQAYLFTGPRGIGKTSITRLFAKALNCKNLTQDLEPCNLCQSCKEISTSSSLDVIEIDGASNRGIDDIRQINDTVGYAPAHGKYKIYIIDEVHMLTKEAFNALLKTLEEPPPTIKFFFATTEPHKVLPTIISRCQRFDLKPISQTLLIEKLKEIVQDQQREIEEEPLLTITKLSDGSLRDAESMLDQILCYTDDKITSQVMNQIFGLVAEDYYFKIDKAIQNVDLKTAIEISDSLYKEGKDFSFFIEQLIDHYREILLINLKKREPTAKTSYLADSYTIEQSLYILDLLMKGLLQIQRSSSKRCFLEMLLIQVIQSKNRITLPSLIQRLQTLCKSDEVSVSSEKPPQINRYDLKKEQLEDLDTNATIPDPISIKKMDVMQSAIKSEDPSKLPKIENTVIEPSKSEVDYSLEKDRQNQYDTLLNFTAVEMNGFIKKE